MDGGGAGELLHHGFVVLEVDHSVAVHVCAAEGPGVGVVVEVVVGVVGEVVVGGGRGGGKEDKEH